MHATPDSSRIATVAIDLAKDVVSANPGIANCADHQFL